MSNDDTCPLCGNDLRGEPIPFELQRHMPDCPRDLDPDERCFCKPYGESTHYSTKAGVVVRGQYDGVLFWVDSLGCGRAWPREFGTIRMAEISQRAVDEYNAAAMTS